MLTRRFPLSRLLRFIHIERASLSTQESLKPDQPKKKEDPKKKPNAVASTKKKPLMLVSEYGELLDIKPMIKTKPEIQYREVSMIGDNTDSKTLLKKLYHNPNMYFLYDPKGHFTNAQTFYLAMKKLSTEKYFGRKGRKSETNPLKGTVFEKCQLPFELFNVNRMVKMNTKQLLSRMGFLTLRDGTIEIQGKNKPEIPEMKNILISQEREFDIPGFEKPDYFTSFPFIEGVISSDNMKTQGIKIRCLQDKLIYPLYGVWSPTSQDYLELVANYVSQSSNQFRAYSNMADLGCGTGILPILINQKGDFNGKIYAFDKETNCIESSRMNSQIFGLSDKFNPIEIDINEFYFPKTSKFTDNQLEFYKSITEELGIPMQFDLITCNPPWIPAEYIAESSPLDNGVYDPKEQFINSALNFAKIHLSSKGEMLMVYSDLAMLLGLQEENKIPQLANKYGLRAELIDKTSLQINRKPHDPLKMIKKEAKIQLFKITK